MAFLPQTLICNIRRVIRTQQKIQWFKIKEICFHLPLIMSLNSLELLLLKNAYTANLACLKQSYIWQYFKNYKPLNKCKTYKSMCNQS